MKNEEKMFHAKFFNRFFTSSPHSSIQNLTRLNINQCRFMIRAWRIRQREQSSVQGSFHVRDFWVKARVSVVQSPTILMWPSLSSLKFKNEVNQVRVILIFYNVAKINFFSLF